LKKLSDLINNSIVIYYIANSPINSKKNVCRENKHISSKSKSNHSMEINTCRKREGK
jgi:hypothetical protein